LSEKAAEPTLKELAAYVGPPPSYKEFSNPSVGSVMAEDIHKPDSEIKFGSKVSIPLWELQTKTKSPLPIGDVLSFLTFHSHEIMRVKGWQVYLQTHASPWFWMTERTPSSIPTVDVQSAAQSFINGIIHDTYGCGIVEAELTTYWQRFVEMFWNAGRMAAEAYYGYNQGSRETGTSPKGGRLIDL
jgi:hypothetical protein